ncbi:cytochrome P450 family protein [Streptomyces sp. NPDC001858]
MTNTEAEPNPFGAVLGEERHAMYAAMAAKGVIHPFTSPMGTSGWLVTGYEESRALMADPRLIRGGWRAGFLADKLPEDVARGIHSNALHNDPPAHTRLRKLVAPLFTKRRVEKLIPRIQEMTDELLAAADQTEPIDLITALAYPLPLNVICELLGIPEEGRVHFREWTHTIANIGAYGYEDFEKAVTSLLEYSRELISAKRLEPTDDLLSDLIAMRDGEDRLSEDELTSTFFIMLLAGHETTVNVIGNGVHALLTHRDQLELLRERPELMDSAIEEFLRFDGPGQVTQNAYLAEPMEVGGVSLPEGAVVHFAVIAANRDEERFPSADTLDITRNANGHLSFGHGIHYCLGAQLARAEVGIVFSTLLDRYPDLRLAVPEEELLRSPSRMMHGLSTLPVLLH